MTTTATIRETYRVPGTKDITTLSYRLSAGLHIVFRDDVYDSPGRDIPAFYKAQFPHTTVEAARATWKEMRGLLTEWGYVRDAV